MNDTHPHPAPTLRHAAPDELLLDVLRFGPAPNPSREAFVTVVNLVIVGVLLAILSPEATAVTVVAIVFGAITALRWLAGVGRWRTR